MTVDDATVHTSAPEPEPDLFGAAQVAVQPDLSFQIVGVLLHAAEVRTKVVGEDHHPRPVLCMDLRPVSGLRRVIHAEQVFTEATRALAEEKAATLKRGAHVTFTTTLAGSRTIFPHVRLVALSP